MIINSLWTGKARGRDNYTGHVLAYVPGRGTHCLYVMYVTNGNHSEPERHTEGLWVRQDGKRNIREDTDWDLVGFDFDKIKTVLTEEGALTAATECQKEALVLMIDGKTKEKLGALACAERFARLAKGSPKSEVKEPCKYHLWDSKRKEFWKPLGDGYTAEASLAGVFDEAWKERHPFKDLDHLHYQPVS